MNPRGVIRRQKKACPCRQSQPNRPDLGCCEILISAERQRKFSCVCGLLERLLRKLAPVQQGASEHAGVDQVELGAVSPRGFEVVDGEAQVGRNAGL